MASSSTAEGEGDDGDFDLPFDRPYPEQLRLMQSIRECIRSSAVGIFESPTGTGKSLSLICSSFQWLMAEERQIVGQLEQEVNETSSSGKQSAMGDDTDDDWIGALIAGTSTEVVNSSSFVKSSGRHTAFDAYKSMVDRVKHAKTLSYSTGRSASHHGFNNSFSKDQSGVMSTGHPAPKSRPESEWLEELYDGSELAAASSSSSSSISDIAAASPDDIFLLAHYEATNPSSGHKDRGDEGLDDDEDDGLTGGPINISQALGLPQIYYCSRTHSQIAQFISEIRRTSHRSIRCVTLGSRKNMCVHPELSKLSSEAALTEACLELQKQKSVAGTTTSTKKEKEEAVHYSSSIDYKRKAKKVKTQRPVKKEKCPYHKASREHQLADRLLASVCDLEDLVALGEGEYSACPYYASRKAVHNSQVVCMPYSVLLHRDIREAVGLDDVRGKVIIFDEAHNVMEAINQLYSAELSGTQVQLASSSLSMYRSRFQSKLTGENFYYISVLVEVVKKLASAILRASKAASLSSSPSLSSSLSSSSSSSSSLSTGTCSEVANGNGRENTVNRNSVETIGGTSSTTTMTINDFLFSAGLDKVNLYQLKRYMVATNLVNKVGGFAQSVSAAVTNEATSKTDVIYALRCVLDLLVCLTNAEVDGRIFMLNNSSSCQSTALVGPTVIKYVMLNPSLHFLPLLSARSVIFVGGTLQPLSYFTSLLLPTVPPERLRFLSCDHIVPPSQIASFIVPCGSQGHPMEFTFAKRLSLETTNDLFTVLTSILTSVPGGVVVFFTSYSYMEAVVARWRSNGMFLRLDAIKRIFLDGRATSNSADIESVWSNYQHRIETSCGQAVLFSVIGGKLSEGINFSDDLARCVAVVGLPYPDTRDPVLQEKIRYASLRDGAAAGSSHPHVGGGGGGGGAVNSQRFCEALCMKAVNQSIGRSIRHINDHSAIVLLDHRYGGARIQELLPQWIRNNTRTVMRDDCCSSGALSLSLADKLSDHLKEFFAAQTTKDAFR